MHLVPVLIKICFVFVTVVSSLLELVGFIFTWSHINMSGNYIHSGNNFESVPSPKYSNMYNVKIFPICTVYLTPLPNFHPFRSRFTLPS